jgi:hypothetical protein
VKISIARKVCITLGALAATATLSGCGLIGKKVNAYERNVLSKPGMALVEHARERAAMNHMFNAREGSVGGFGGAGGGCGCN